VTVYRVKNNPGVYAWELGWVLVNEGKDLGYFEDRDMAQKVADLLNAAEGNE